MAIHGKISFRQAVLDDAPSILDINGQGIPGVSELCLDELKCIVMEAPYLRVVEIDGAVAGYMIAYTSDSMYDGEEFRWFCRRYIGMRFLYIDQVAIGVSCRRSGLGARFYEEAELWAVSQGISRLVCEVNLRPPNPSSLCFHTRMGYLGIGELELQDGRKAMLMAKEISMK